MKPRRQIEIFFPNSLVAQVISEMNIGFTKIEAHTRKKLARKDENYQRTIDSLRFNPPQKKNQ